MIEHYYECNHGLVAVIDCRTYLLTEDIILKYAIRPKFGSCDDVEYSESYDDEDYVEHFCDD